MLLGLVLGEMGTAVPHACAFFHSLLPSLLWLVSTNSPLENRARAQHLMRGCAPTRMSEATTSAAVPMVKELRYRETIRCKHFALNHGTTDIHFDRRRHQDGTQ